MGCAKFEKKTDWHLATSNWGIGLGMKKYKIDDIYSNIKKIPKADRNMELNYQEDTQSETAETSAKHAKVKPVKGISHVCVSLYFTVCPKLIWIEISYPSALHH